MTAALRSSATTLGNEVEGFFGCSEYEFERRLSPAQVAALRAALGSGPGSDLLDVIEERFDSTRDLESFLTERGIDSEFWSRVGN